MARVNGRIDAGTAIAAALIFGLFATTIGFVRAERHRRIATSHLYVSDVNSAYQAWEQGNIDRVRDLLERHRPQPGGDDLRGFEWHYLWGEYERALKIPTVIQGSTATVAYSPDGTILASAGGDVKLWDVATRKQLRALRHESAKCIAFSPDGTILASGGGDQTVRLWEPATGEHVAQLSPAQTINALAFSPDGKLLAAGCGQRLAGELRLWDVATHAEVANLSGHTATVATVAFSPDGKILASGGRDRTIKLWDVESGAEFNILRGHTAGISALAFSPNGARLATGGDDGSLKLWEMSSRTVAAEFPGTLRSSNCLAFSPSGATLAVGTASTAGCGSGTWPVPEQPSFAPGIRAASARSPSLRTALPWRPEVGTE